jgi:hypothetical protein
MSAAKRNSLLLLLLAILLILVLAMGLPDLKLSPGQPFSLGQEDESTGGGYGVLLSGDYLVWILRGLWVLTLICVPFYIFFSIFTPEGRSRLKRDIILLGILYLISEYLPKLLQNTEIFQENQVAALPQGLSQIQNLEPTVSFSPNPPPWLTIITIILATLLFSVLILGLFKLLRRRKPLQKSSLEMLADEAQNAMEALRAGRDLKSTIIRCYQEMGRVVEEERGIFRETAMTPREFEAHLAAKGLPQEPVRTITRLFEKVRYGSVPVDSREEEQAVSSLSAIVDACQSIGAAHEI